MRSRITSGPWAWYILWPCFWRKSVSEKIRKWTVRPLESTILLGNVRQSTFGGFWNGLDENAQRSLVHKASTANSAETTRVRRKSCLETERNKRRRQFQNFWITSWYNLKRAIETAVMRAIVREWRSNFEEKCLRLLLLFTIMYCCDFDVGYWIHCVYKLSLT